VKISFNAVDSEASGAYRVIRPLTTLRDLYDDVEIEPLNTSSIQKPDIVVLQCLVGPQNFELIRKLKKESKVVIDYDDYFADLPESIISRFGASSQKEITKNWCKYLNLADLITAPCEMLARHIRRHTDTAVEVLPNLLTREEYQDSVVYTPHQDMNNEVRILYSCSKSHLKDFKWIAPVLEQVAKNKKVKIISHGALDFTYLKPNFKGRAKHINACPFNSYLSTLREVRPHIMIAPLHTNMHSVCRSNIKYLQAGLLKTAFVGNDLPPYDCVRHRRTGLLCSLKLGWWWTLRKLVNNPQKIEELGVHAFLDAHNYILEDHIQLWRKAYSNIL